MSGLTASVIAWTSCGVKSVTVASGLGAGNDGCGAGMCAGDAGECSGSTASSTAVDPNQFGLLKNMILHAFLHHLFIDPLRLIEHKHCIKSIQFKEVPMCP